MPIHQNVLIGAAGSGSSGFIIEDSVWFDGSNDSLSRTFSDSDGTEFIFSVWVKRTSFSDNDTIFSAGSSPNRDIYFFVSNQLYINLNDGSDAQLATSGVFRDTAWYHILVSHHHGEGTASDRIKVYVNGVEPSLTTTNYPSSSTYVGKFNENQVHYLGSNHGSGSENWFSGYMADPLFIDTKSIQEGDFAITDFGGFDANTGIWIPKEFSGSYGTNGFKLNFSDASNLGADTSGNGNNFTVNGSMATTQQVTDSPTNDADNNIGNYATLNPLSPSLTGTLSNGNLTWDSPSSSGGRFGTILLDQTKEFYWEVTVNTTASVIFVGIASTNLDTPASMASGTFATYRNNGTKNVDASGSAYGAAWSNGNVIGIHFDGPDGEITFYVNDSSQGAISFTAADQYFPFFNFGASSSASISVNFGQTAFSYTPKGGSVRLNTANMTSGYTGSLSAAIVTTNATEANIKATTEGAHSFSNWISFLYNADATEDKIFYASDDPSNFIPFADDTVLGKNSFPTLAGSQNWRGCAIATGASTGIATGTISHTNGSGDSTGAHGLTSPTGRFSILISSEATSSHDGWFWFHPDMTANNNIRLAQGGSEGQQSSKYYAAVTSSNAIVKSAAPSGTYRYIVFAENDLVSFYSYVNFSGTDSAYVHTNNKPEWMLWGQMTETGGGYGQYMAWSGTHNAYNPWTKAIRIHNNSTTERTGSVDVLASGLKVREASPGDGVWHQTDGQTTCGISIGTPFPLNNRAE